MNTKDQAKAAVEGRIFSGEPFTFHTLCPLCENVEGMQDGWRVADAAIQRNRKKGLISFERKGRESIWSLTDAGKSEAERRASS